MRTHNAFLSVAAPVGFGFNTGFGKGGSLGLFTSIIDVGAIAAFRFGDNDAADLPALSIKNILAPGAYLVYGFPCDLPLSLGFGAQLGPNLREINTTPDPSMPDVIEPVFKNGWKYGFFLAVDIPLFNLYVR